MRNLEEYYILGLPVDIDIGECSFVKIKDYPDVANDLAIMTLTKDHIVNMLCEKQPRPKVQETVENLKDTTLRDLVFSIPEIKTAYLRVLATVFNDESLANFQIEDFDKYRSLILKMNCQKEEKINPNPEIQRAIERSKRVKARDGEKLSFSDMVTSVVGFNGLSYKGINELTLYQLHMTFQRIGQIKGYDTSTLFATVPGSKVKVESWSKHIDILQDNKHFLTEGEFNKNIGSALKD